MGEEEWIKGERGRGTDTENELGHEHNHVTRGAEERNSAVEWEREPSRTAKGQQPASCLLYSAGMYIVRALSHLQFPVTSDTQDTSGQWVVQA